MSFANNFWGKDDTGYARVFQRMHNAKQTCEELVTFYKERAAIEQEYSRRLLSLSKKGLGSNETGNLKLSLDTVKATTEAMARSHELTAKQITDQLNAPLGAFSASLRDRRKTVEDTMGRLTKAKVAQNANAEKLRARYEGECHKISGYQAQQNLLIGHELEKNNQKLERSKFNVESAQRQYQDSLRVLAQSMEAWNAEWRVSCEKLQNLEEERINFMKSNLWAFANAISTVCVSDDEGCETTRVALEKTEAAKDLAQWVQENSTGAHIQDPPEFVNFLNGFGRDDNDNHYRIANFSAPTDPAGSGSGSGFGSSSGSMGPDTESQPNRGLTGSRSIPNLAIPTLAPDSPPLSYESPGSPGSAYSANTSVSGSSPQLDKDVKTTMAQKRRSWAMPFKRKSTPDLGAYRAQESTTSFEFGPALNGINGPTSSSAPRVDGFSVERPATKKVQIQTPSKTSAIGTAGDSNEDPLVAALEKLKPNPVAMPQPRPTSMPPNGEYMSRSPQSRGGMAPYGNGQVTAANSGAGTGAYRARSPVRKEVGSSSLMQPSQGVPRSKSANDVHSQSRIDPDAARAQAAYAQQRPQQSQQPQYNRRSAGPYMDGPYSAITAYKASRPMNIPKPQSQPSAYSYQQAQAQAPPQGYSPPHRASATPQPKLPSVSSNGQRVLRHSRAQYDYRAAIAEEVSFRKGDVMLVVGMQEDGWWDVEVLGKRQFGLAPSNFLTDV